MSLFFLTPNKSEYINEFSTPSFQRKLIEKIPKSQRGIYDNDDIDKLKGFEDNQTKEEGKQVKFNFGETEVINYNKKLFKYN